VRVLHRDARRDGAVRVLMLVENNPYPADFRVRREAHALRDAGYRVTVIGPRGAGQRWVELQDGIVVYRFPALSGASGVAGYMLEFGYATFAMLLLSFWVALRSGFDVIHAANPPDTLWAIGAVFKLGGKRFVFDHHDLAPETYLSRFGVARRNLVYRVLALLEACSYSVADVVIATNQSYRQTAVQRGGKSPERVFVVRNGPPLDYGAIPAEWAVPRMAARCIAYVGTIGPQDGLDHWLRAIYEMVNVLGRHEFVAVVIGDGDALASVKSLARELEIDRYVLFTGRLSELETRRQLAVADVCVQPDPHSPLNDKSTMNKLMEYMALGKPTVAFDLLETRVTAGDAAVYARPNDEAEFARHVCRLLDDPEERRRMGEIGRQRVQTALAWEYSVPELLRAYAVLAR
jgi:glycosyltransferase involved in cell wall biosynthesis